MQNVWVSSKRVINKIERMFGLKDDNWIPEAIEAIGDTMAYLQCNALVRKVTVDKEIVDHKVALPCDAEYIVNVMCGDFKLHMIQPTRFDIQNPVGDDYPYDQGYYDGPYLKTTFETGTVTFHYYKFDADEDGFPMIPNSEQLFEACAWNFMRYRTLKGIPHPTANYQMCEQQWELYSWRANNDLKFPGIENQEQFNRMWASMVHDITLNLGNFINYKRMDTINGDITQFTGNTLT